MSKRKRTFNHGNKESRLRKAYQRLGSENAHSILGRETNPHALELHHVAGQQFDPETIVLSRNYHARITDAQKDHPTKIAECINPLEGLGHFLLGLGEIVAVALEELGDQRLREFLTYLRWRHQELGTRLIEFARTLPNETFGGGP